jgi:hypothetical protein
MVSADIVKKLRRASSEEIMGANGSPSTEDWGTGEI